MAFENDFRAFLAGSARVQTHVGSSNSARIEAMRLPEGISFPALRYQRIDTVREVTQDGPTGLPRIRMQVDSYGLTQGQAFDTADAVRKTLDGFVGQMNGTGVGVALNEDEDARWEEDAEVFRVRQDYMIHYREATT